MKKYIILIAAIISTLFIACKDDEGSKNGLEKINFDTPRLCIEMNKVKQIEYSLVPETASSEEIVWTSSNPEVATVKDGLVTAVKEGFVKISATANGGKIVNTAYVNVVDKYIPVEKIFIEADKMTVMFGRYETVHYTVYPHNATDTLLEWTSSNPEIMQTDQFGNIYATMPGTVTITAKANSGAEASLDAEVDYIPIEKLTIRPSFYDFSDMYWGDIYLLTVDAYPKAATYTGDMNHFEYKSSNEKVVTCSGNIIRCEGPGEAEITVRDGIDGQEVKQKVVVKDFDTEEKFHIAPHFNMPTSYNEAWRVSVYYMSYKAKSEADIEFISSDDNIVTFRKKENGELDMYNGREPYLKFGKNAKIGSKVTITARDKNTGYESKGELVIVEDKDVQIGYEYTGGFPWINETNNVFDFYIEHVPSVPTYPDVDVFMLDNGVYELGEKVYEKDSEGNITSIRYKDTKPLKSGTTRMVVFGQDCGNGNIRNVHVYDEIKNDY